MAEPNLIDAARTEIARGAGWVKIISDDHVVLIRCAVDLDGAELEPAEAHDILLARGLHGGYPTKP